MKFVVSARDLRRALATCNEVAPSTSVVAEEKTGVLLRASGKTVVFMSADDTNYVSVEVDAQVSQPGEALVRASAVDAAVRASYEEFGFDGRDNFVSLETTSKSTLKLTGANRVREGKAHPIYRNFPLLNTGFFVEMPSFDVAKATTIPPFRLMDGLMRVGHAASKDSSKLHFNCINFTLTDKEAVFAATDGIQIAELREAVEVKGLRGSFILGLKFASIAAKLINPEKDANLYVEDDFVFLKVEGTTLVGALINASFPAYAPFMATEKLLKAIFPHKDFMSVLAGMQPTMDAKSHRIVLEAGSDGTATLSTSSVSGEAESTGLDVKTPANFNLHFDANLLQNAIRQLKGEEFEFYFTPEASGVLIKSPKDENFKSYVCTLKKVS